MYNLHEFLFQYSVHSVAIPSTLGRDLWKGNTNEELIPFAVFLPLHPWLLKPSWWCPAAFSQGKTSHLFFFSLIPELMETSSFTCNLDNLHSILLLWGVGRIEPRAFYSSLCWEFEELGGKISIQRRVFFSLQSSLGEVFPCWVCRALGLLQGHSYIWTQRDTTFVATSSYERKKFSGQKQWQFLDLSSPPPIILSIPK